MNGMLEEARQAFGQESWVHAYEGLARAAEQQPLDAEDLERLAVAAYFVGRDDEAVQAWERAHQVWSRLSEPDRAARAAFWLAFGLMLGGEESRANGWFNRARRLVAGLGADCPAHGYLLVPLAMEALERGDDSEAEAHYLRAFELAERFDDPDLRAIGLLGRGEVAIARGETDEGLALLDEVMVAATTREVSALTVGILYCAVIDACMQAFDLRRAAEWTDALTRWSGGEAEVVPFRGTCLVHRSQVLQAHGEWGEALDEATSAEEWLGRSQHPATGVACYQRGELHRLLGDLEAAEHAYRQASRHGREPSPGFALLCLADGRAEAAAVAVRRMLDEAAGRSSRLVVLPVFVEVMLACGDLEAAERACEELAALASEVGSPLVDALSAHATGSVLLAGGDASGASTSLRRACETWRKLGMPYECARSQELVGIGCHVLGDAETGDVELGAAQEVFEGLGATVDATRVATRRANAGSDQGPAGMPLTARECEVLRLVATGSTNRAIGATLAISEHTVARHVQNIFAKLGLSSRAAATAYASRHGLL